MSNTPRLLTGQPFPEIMLATTNGGKVALNAAGWRALFVIRGAHCQVCQAFLGQLEQHRENWTAKGIDIVVASADPVEKSRAFMKEAGFAGTTACQMDEAQMSALGLWMTGPDQSSLDYIHPEPGFFLIDPDGNVAAAEASTLPFVRPDLALLGRGLGFMLENDIRPPFGRHEVAA